MQDLVSNHDTFQVMLTKMFPSWEDIKKHEEVVIFTCGLMESPELLVDHVYELYKEREITWVHTNTWHREKEQHWMRWAWVCVGLRGICVCGSDARSVYMECILVYVFVDID